MWEPTFNTVNKYFVIIRKQCPIILSQDAIKLEDLIQESYFNVIITLDILSVWDKKTSYYNSYFSNTDLAKGKYKNQRR